MPKAAADFTAILEAAFHAAPAAVFRSKVVSALLILGACLVTAWLFLRFFQRRRDILPKQVPLMLGLTFSGMAIFQGLVVRRAQSVQTAALAQVPEKVRQANGLVQRLLADSTGTVVATESGTYLALAGEQIFLPKPVAEALQKELTAQNLRLP